MKATIGAHGDININIVDILDQMNDEDKQEIIEYFAWQSPIWNELLRGIKEEYSSEHFNGSIHRMREAFFQGEDVDYSLRRVIDSFMSTVLHLQQKVREQEKRLLAWRFWYEKYIEKWPLPVPFSHTDLQFVKDKEVDEFMSANGLDKLYKESNEDEEGS